MSMYQLPDDDLTITLSDDIELDSCVTISIADDTLSTLTLSDVMNDPFGTNNWTITGTEVEPSISLGKHTLTEATFEKIKALLDLVESDQDLKELLATQIAMNKLSNTQE